MKIRTKYFVEQKDILDFARYAMDAQSDIRECAVRFVAACVSCAVCDKKNRGEAIPEDIFDIESECVEKLEPRVKNLIRECGSAYKCEPPVHMDGKEIVAKLKNDWGLNVRK